MTTSSGIPILEVTPTGMAEFVMASSGLIGNEKSFVAMESGPRYLPQFVEPVAEPTITHAVNAQLPFLPAPLRLLHGPLMVTVESWSDGTVVARIPSPPIYSDAENDTLALMALGDEILEYAESVLELLSIGEELAAPTAYQWETFKSLVDISGLSQ